MYRIAYDPAGLWVVTKGSRVIQRASTRGLAEAARRALEATGQAKRAPYFADHL